MTSHRCGHYLVPEIWYRRFGFGDLVSEIGNRIIECFPHVVVGFGLKSIGYAYSGQERVITCLMSSLLFVIVH